MKSSVLVRDRCRRSSREAGVARVVLFTTCTSIASLKGIGVVAVGSFAAFWVVGDTADFACTSAVGVDQSEVPMLQECIEGCGSGAEWARSVMHGESAETTTRGNVLLGYRGVRVHADIHGPVLR